MAEDDATGHGAATIQGGKPGVFGDPTTAKRYLLWGGVVLLALLAAVAMLQVYTNISSAIARFVDPDYRPVFRAVFNLVVLLLAVAGISALLRQLQTIEDEDPERPT